ncbi:MAG TPA: LLM class flavin-dependent oxidoreductase [Candidatus Limnocylindrales bacterium]|nr:LLM class flavin-dependent oxidoreductase [Candidatus Limnocylindrales bacterium]
MAALLIGLGISASPGPGIDPVAEARLAEDLGFDYVSTSDHLNGRTPTYEPWTLLTAVAAVTTRIRVLTRVLAIPYRHPAVLAKMAETLDRLSNGRLILGLGGGYSDDEFRAFGLAVPTNRDKVDAVAEQIAIARALWSEPSATFDGRLYSIHEAVVEPKPEHRIPIWLGMYKPRGLALTGREADGWIPSIGFAPPPVVPGLMQRVRDAAESVGRDPSEVTAAYNMLVRVGDEQPGNVMTVSGPSAAIAEQLLGFRELGFTSFNLATTGSDRLDQIELLGREVLPILRQAS